MSYPPSSNCDRATPQFYENSYTAGFEDARANKARAASLGWDTIAYETGWARGLRPVPKRRSTIVKLFRALAKLDR